MKEQIIELLSSPDYRPTPIDGVYSLLFDGETLYNEFFDAVTELENEGKLIVTQRGKLMPLEGSEYFIGKFRSSQKEFGFVTPEKEGVADFFIPPDRTLDAIDGDRVLCHTI